MPSEQFTNLAETSLSGAVAAGDLTIPVSGISGFPVSAQYRVRVDNEIMIVTGGVGSTSWVVTRGAEGTPAAAHANGVAVRHVLTAGAIGGQSDPAVGVPGLRTLGSGAQQAMPGNRTLDAVPKAVASLDVNTNKILNVVDPVGAQDGATKNYVDSSLAPISGSVIGAPLVWNGLDWTNAQLDATGIVSALTLLLQTGTAAPTTGAHTRGELVWSTTPSAGGFVGWVCVSSGTPGTWKTFGVISA